MPTFFGTMIIAIIVAVDNALLTGLLLPKASVQEKRRLVIIIGVLLGLSQVLLSASVDTLMGNPLFRYAAIILLVWMSMRTLGMYMTRDVSGWTVVLKLWLFTVFGNIDNMIWLGSGLKGDRLSLMIATVATIPLFIAVAIFLSNQSEKQQWILPLGAGMMAWAAAALVLTIPSIATFIGNLDDAPKTTFQCLITVLILMIGLVPRALMRSRFHPNH